MIRVDLQRYEDYIQTLQSYPVHKNTVLLYGSSLFYFWGYERAREQLALFDILDSGEIGVTNHGFGGSTADELLYYYPRLVKPYSPRLILIRTGINDLCSGYTPQEIMLLLARLCEWITTDFPQAEIGLIPFFDVPRPDWQTEQWFHNQAEFNRLCREYADRHTHIRFVDITEFFYTSKEDIGTRRNFKPIFLADGLHMTDDGYSQFSKYFKRKLNSTFG